MDPNDLYSQFRELFLTHYDPLCKYAFTFLKDKESSEDIVQDVFTRIWEKHREVISSSKIRAYLYTAVRNSSFTHLTKENKLPVYSLTNWDTGEEEASP